MRSLWIPFLVVAALTAGCSQQEQAEVDKAQDSSQQAAKSAAKDAGAAAENTAEKAGAAAENAGDKLGAAAENAGESVTNAAGQVDNVVDNAATTGKVKSVLAATKGMEKTNINVDTKDGVVTLKGEVASAAIRNVAVKVTKTVEGVKSVNDQLTVKGAMAR